MASGAVDNEKQQGGVEVVLSMVADFIDPLKMFRNSQQVLAVHSCSVPRVVNVRARFSRGAKANDDFNQTLCAGATRVTNDPHIVRRLDQ
jgi:hypothetical protein